MSFRLDEVKSLLSCKLKRMIHRDTESSFRFLLQENNNVNTQTLMTQCCQETWLTVAVFFLSATSHKTNRGLVCDSETFDEVKAKTMAAISKICDVSIYTQSAAVRPEQPHASQMHMGCRGQFQTCPEWKRRFTWTLVLHISCILSIVRLLSMISLLTIHEGGFRYTVRVITQEASH